MILQKAKYIELVLTGEKKQYFPDIRDLRYQRIDTIMSFVSSFSDSFLLSKSGNPTADANSFYISLTENGQDYFFNDLSLRRFRADLCRGHFIKIGRMLSFTDCYINNPLGVTGESLQLVVWYSDGNKTQQAGNSRLDYANIELVAQSGYQNPFPDNKRLTGKKIRNVISVFGNVTLTSDNLEVINADQFYNSFVTLRRGTELIFDSVPLLALKQDNWWEPLRLADIQFDFDNSYVQTAATLDVSADLNKYYILEFKYI